MNGGRLIASVVALGTFDGMHIGHRAVIRRAVSLAKEKGLVSVVYTFSNHPRSIFAEAPRPLMTAGERRHAMEQMGIDRVDMVEFTRETAALSPEAFLEMLLERYDIKALVAGSDYTYGYKGAGTIETLKEAGKKFGFEVCEVTFVMLGGEKVSSTRIREALAEGNAHLAQEMLGD